jgi:CheY-like chemotaxis protein
VSSHSVPRVFVVDDEHVIASTLAAILTLHGYSATSFTSPQEALAAARSSAPDLLISDVLMPGFSGVDLAIQIKAQCPACKILLFQDRRPTEIYLRMPASRATPSNCCRSLLTRAPCSPAPGRRQRPSLPYRLNLHRGSSRCRDAPEHHE